MLPLFASVLALASFFAAALTWEGPYALLPIACSAVGFLAILATVLAGFIGITAG